jgi:alpha-tubulin suppressor-like RCC1 family protein
VSIQAYDVSTFSLRANGSVWSWGNNSNGQLGDGTTTTRSTPVQVVGPGGSGYLQGIVSLADGNGSAAGLSSDGTVYAWGSGILGNNTSTGSHTPVQVVGPNGIGYLTQIVQIAEGLTKGANEYRALTKWLARNPNGAYSDRLVAQSLADELKGAFGPGFASP